MVAKINIMALSRLHEIETVLEKIVDLYLISANKEGKDEDNDELLRPQNLVNTYIHFSELEYSNEKFLSGLQCFLSDVSETYTSIDSQPIDINSTKTGLVAAIAVTAVSFITSTPPIIVPAAMFFGYTVQNLAESRRRSKLFNKECNVLIEKYAQQLEKLIEE